MLFAIACHAHEGGGSSIVKVLGDVARKGILFGLLVWPWVYFWANSKYLRSKNLFAARRTEIYRQRHANRGIELVDFIS